MIDVYSLINSKDVEKHCRTINHQFNTKEIAALIIRCEKLSLQQKIEHFKEILKDPEMYPDMIVKNHLIGERKIWELIKGDIEKIKKVIKKFNQTEENSVFTLEYIQSCDKRIIDNFVFPELTQQGGIFKTLKDVHKFIKIEGCSDEYYSGYRIRKRYINSSFYSTHKFEDYILFEYKRTGRKKFMLMNYDYHYDDDYNLFSDIQNFWINIPTPFKKGDIVDTKSQYGKGVVHHVCNDDEEYFKGKEEDDDSMGMTCYCLFVNETHIYWEC